MQKESKSIFREKSAKIQVENQKRFWKKSKTNQEEIDVEMKKNKQQHFGRLSGGKNVGTIEDQRETWLL